MSSPFVSRCLNCGQQLSGRYCSRCGQDGRQNKKALAAFGYDFIESSLNYDAKFWRTLVPFVLRPGYLTTEYNAGRRVRYLHPRKMYFFVSIVFFLLFALFDDTRLLDVYRDKGDLLKTASNMAQTAAPMTGEIESGIQSATGQRLPLRIRVAHKLEYLKQMDRALLKERFSRSVASNIPRMLFLLLPVFALFTMLLFRRPVRYYVEHLVFAFHTHTYAFAIAAIALVYEKMTADTRTATWALGLILPYSLLSMRAVYRNAWHITLFKFVVVLGLYAVAIAIALTVLVALTFWFI